MLSSYCCYCDSIDNDVPHALSKIREEGEMSMETDVNYLLHRQQMSMIRAEASPSIEGRAAYETLARSYLDRIDAYRRQNERLIIPAH